LTQSYARRLNVFSAPNAAHSLKSIKRGIEKESLRVTSGGKLSQSPHPSTLGSALTHPSITTDYSEALLEFITPAFTDETAPLKFLDQVQHFVYANIEDELLWVNSMPCLMETENNIRIAEYGSSNIGKMKTVYRRGLGLRYGRLMQTIAGIHYNFSFPESFWQVLQESEQNTDSLQDYISTQYFGLIRNFQNYSPLLNYLFGASPAVCASFLRDNSHHDLVPFKSSHTLHKPFATSLRMSDLGYQNDAQSNLSICYNSLENYVKTLDHAIRTPYPKYQQIGVTANNEYQQLNANILQLENEYYGSIRPKRVTQTGERPTLALQRRGVEYVEFRCTDLNPFLPLGIDQTQTRFYDVFALFCALKESPICNQDTLDMITENTRNSVMDGRNPQLMMQTEQGGQLFSAWAHELLEAMIPAAEILDSTGNQTHFMDALKEQVNKVNDPEQTPSAQVLKTLEDNDIEFFQFAMGQAKRFETQYKSTPLENKVEQDFMTLSKQSMQDQQQLELECTQPFEQFIADYFK